MCIKSGAVVVHSLKLIQPSLTRGFTRVDEGKNQIVGKLPAEGGEHRGWCNHGCLHEAHLADTPVSAALPNTQAYNLKGIFDSVVCGTHSIDPISIISF